MIFVLVVTAILTTFYFAYPNSSNANTGEKTFLSHNGAVIKTTGDVLDPVYSAQTLKFDPDKYLREFNYGRVSKLADGTTLREFTIIAEDDKMMEISPGVFYNVWTFNGTVPGPKIRATEGDLVRIYFINNGSRQHTMHFHGEHPGEMDGVFEIVG